MSKVRGFTAIFGNEKDFAEHIQRQVASDPFATQWHFVSDNLTFTCPNLWCGMLQKNPISTWV